MTKDLIDFKRGLDKFRKGRSVNSYYTWQLVAAWDSEANNSGNQLLEEAAVAFIQSKEAAVLGFPEASDWSL